MRELTPVRDWVQMRENVRRAIQALEVCWRCQRVSECQKYVLGNMVLVWLCPNCLAGLHQPSCNHSKKRNRLLQFSKTANPDSA